MQALEARMQERFRRSEGQMQQQARRAAKDVEASRRAEDNLLEIAKGLTTASIRSEERLKDVERRMT